MLKALNIAPIAALVLLLTGNSTQTMAMQTAQASQIKIVTPGGPGLILLPSGTDWKPQSLTAYDHGTRPVAQLSQQNTGLTVSFILFPRDGGDPTPAGCREDVIGPIAKGMEKQISERKDADAKNTAGTPLATTTYLLDLGPSAMHAKQRNLFAFAANAKTCAEIHISSVHETAANNSAMTPAMTALVASFNPDLSYQPTALDYLVLGNFFFKGTPESAVPYFAASLKSMPPDTPPTSPARRVVTDQLIMALGMSGDLKSSRTVAEEATTLDPDYPLNYYNLACADAEQGNAAAAKTHLQQAFDRRANTLKGESLPDPAKDDSILKLKSNKEFWQFVLSLPKT